MLGITKALDDVFALRGADAIWPNRALSVACGGCHTLVVLAEVADKAERKAASQVASGTADGSTGQVARLGGQTGKLVQAAAVKPTAAISAGEIAASRIGEVTAGGIGGADVRGDAERAHNVATTTSSAPTSPGSCPATVPLASSLTASGPVVVPLSPALPPRKHERATVATSSSAPALPPAQRHQRTRGEAVTRSVSNYGTVISFLPPPVDAEWSDAMSSTDSSSSEKAAPLSPEAVIETPVQRRRTRSELNSTARAERRRTRALE